MTHGRGTSTQMDRQEDEGRGRDTWPKVLTDNYRKYGDDRKAMRHKRYGIWKVYTWKDYYLDVKYLALGLLALGFKSGDKLLIVGDNAPQWHSAELAAQANHGAAVGAYPDLTPSELLHVARNADVRFAVVQDQEQVDKLFEVKDALPLVEKIIFWSYKGLAHYDNRALIGYREVLELGEKHEKNHPGLFEENVETGRADEVCAIVYTAATTGPAPKAAVHTYRTMRAGSEYYLRLDPWHERDEVVPHLPPAGITGQWAAIGCHLLSGCVVNFAEGPETQQRDAQEIGPTVVMYEARVWESLAATMQARILGVDGLKKLSLRLLMPIGYALADSKFLKSKRRMLSRSLYRLAYLIMFRAIKEKLGLARARICYSTGAILSSEAMRFYHALELPLKSVYETTEGGALAGARSDEIRLDTIGPPFEGADVRITEAGEIVYRPPGLFLGYHKDPANTANAIKDGWFHSGDRGRIGEDGHLIFLDTAGGIVELATGDRVSLQFIESRLRSSPYIRDAWVFAGPDRAYVSAVIVINYRAVASWAGRRRIAFNNFGELSQSPEVYDLVKQNIERINGTLALGCRLRKYVNLHKEFDPDEGELTRTRNLRRARLEERYREMIGAIYAGETHAPVETRASRQDGRTETKSIALTIASVGAAVS